MMARIRKLLGLTHRVEPITMKDVDPAPMDPKIETQVKASTAALVTDLLHMERSSWELRQVLASRTLRLVVHKRQGRHHHDQK